MQWPITTYQQCHEASVIIIVSHLLAFLENKATAKALASVGDWHVLLDTQLLIDVLWYCYCIVVLISFSDVLVAMQDPEAGLVLQHYHIHNKDYNNCFTGSYFYLTCFSYVLRQLSGCCLKTILWANFNSSATLCMVKNI